MYTMYDIENFPYRGSTSTIYCVFTDYNIILLLVGSSIGNGSRTK